MRHAQQRRNRRGVSAVELAIVLPFLLIFLLGGIDTGQAVDVWNKVDNASREGARLAARLTTTTDTEVRNAVTTYLSQSFPHVSSADISNGLTVTVMDDAGNTITDISSIATGDPVLVDVTLDYDTVRWSQDLGFLSTKDISTTTRMRRE